MHNFRLYIVKRKSILLVDGKIPQIRAKDLDKYLAARGFKGYWRIFSKTRKNNLTVYEALLIEPDFMVPNSAFADKPTRWVNLVRLSPKSPYFVHIWPVLKYLKKPKIILVTGTPGVGKTTFSRELSLLIRAKHIELTRFIKSEAIGSLENSEIEVKTSDLCQKMQERAQKAQKTLIFDGHLSHYFPSKMADICLVLGLKSLKILKKRLKSRGYSQDKIRDNLDSEIFKVCLVEALESGHSVLNLEYANKPDLRRFLRDYGSLFMG